MEAQLGIGWAADLLVDISAHNEAHISGTRMELFFEKEMAGVPKD